MGVRAGQRACQSILLSMAIGEVSIDGRSASRFAVSYLVVPMEARRMALCNGGIEERA